MNHFLIGIAGGSGSGKSVLSYGLKDNYPDLIEVVHFDDYQKEESDVPLFNGMRNWDHPDAINFEQLQQDLLQLKEDKEVILMTKSGILNPTYEDKGRIRHTLKPKKIIIIEGYLALQNKKVANLLNLKIFLDIPIIESIKRRDKITYNNETEYNHKILVPMHSKYVAPTKEIADLSIDVLKNDGEKVYKIVHDKLHGLELLPF